MKDFLVYLLPGEALDADHTFTKLCKCVDSHTLLYAAFEYYIHSDTYNLEELAELYLHNPMAGGVELESLLMAWVDSGYFLWEKVVEPIKKERSYVLYNIFYDKRIQTVQLTLKRREDSQPFTAVFG